MHANTVINLLLLSGAATVALAREGPPKPKQPFTNDMMNTCGCDVPALIVRECQNIPSSASAAEKKACICESQNKVFGPFWRYHFTCSACSSTNAEGQEKFPELSEYMGLFNGFAGAMWGACYYGDCIGCPGDRPTLETNGNSVCASGVEGMYCAHVGEDAASGWVSIEGAGEPNGKTTVSATFQELKVENAEYAFEKVVIPDSGYKNGVKKGSEKKDDKKDEKKDDKKDEEKDVKKDEEKDVKKDEEKDVKKDEEKDVKKDEEKDVKKDEEKDDKKDDAGDNMDDADVSKSEDVEKKPDAEAATDKNDDKSTETEVKDAAKDGDNADSGAVGLKGSGFAAALGISIALFML
ncbi:hypothetical protein BJ508DRAFT_322496 [Ascobolus immersus RN42]|uniref:Uncharacterized protein n=1 Tax=Ascobolus immersus RN42 TaxID=1160509 RepID=A0A3N4IH23_ASCIM|nr:hypothetical protein BJ508DRAFT_322496 [Ascobolus immersus RN42]